MDINRKTILLFIILLIISIISGCNKDDQSRLQANWSAKDPIAIPFNNRNHQLKLGNLVPNSSFEFGKIFYKKNDIKTFDIAGWKKVGENIEWVNTRNADFNDNETYDGIHAVKIVRNQADETENLGEGIISDYIKVIPGNYTLKLFLKLENICPNQARIGTKMFDAVNIRIQYFDKNKIEIEGTEFNPYENKKIDNTFKSLTLANYWNIDDFGWGEIHGKTANYPFFDGDIPDQARYVKIFIGLKGTGKMWIDQIDFRYTSNNFTLFERLKPYFDSSFTAYDFIIPEPQLLEKKNTIEYFNTENKKLPIILIPENANKYLIHTAQLIKEKLDQITGGVHPEFAIDKIKILKQLNKEQLTDDQFIISIGKSSLYKKNQKSLPDSMINELEQAYYIYSLENFKNILFINANDKKGFENAVLTFNQLLSEKETILHNAKIIDYPDFKERNFIIHGFNGSEEYLTGKIDLFKRYKLNEPYFEIYKDNKKYYPLISLNEILKENDCINLKVNLFDNKEINSEQLIQILRPYKSINSLLVSGSLNQTSEGCNSVSLKVLMNDYYNHANPLTLFEPAIQKNKIKNIEYLSYWNNLELIDNAFGQAEFYFRDIRERHLNNTSFVWTGGSYCSSSIDFAELNRFKTIVGNNHILLDNSLFLNESRFSSEYIRAYYAGKIRILSMFEPYRFEVFDDFYKQSSNKKILLNTDSLSELSTIRILTSSNFYWNTESYNPDRTLWIVLNKLFGRQNAMNLIYFNDAYYGLKEVCEKIKINGLQYKNIRVAKIFEKDLKKYYDLLLNDLENSKLLSEIELLKETILLDYNNLISTNN